jgi:hypothetical protein
MNLLDQDVGKFNASIKVALYAWPCAVTPDCTYWAGDNVCSELAAKQAHTPFVELDAVAHFSQNGEKNATVASILKNEERGRWVPTERSKYDICAIALVRRRSPTHRGQTQTGARHAALPTMRTNKPVS